MSPAQSISERRLVIHGRCCDCNREIVPLTSNELGTPFLASPAASTSRRCCIDSFGFRPYLTPLEFARARPIAVFSRI